MLENQRWAAFETRRKSHVAAYLLWLLLGIWVLLDVFRIPGFVRAYNDRLIRWLSGDVATRRRSRRQQAVFFSGDASRSPNQRRRL